MALDPAIVAVFGEPPAGLDLNAQTATTCNIIVCVVFGIAVGAVVLRLWVRHNKAGLWWDDYAIVVSLVGLPSTWPRPYGSY